MKKHPIISTGLLTLTSLALLLAWMLPARSFTFSPDSRIWVEGTSTIHDWTCEVGTFDGALDVLPDTGDLERLTALDVTVPVDALDCKNGTMDKKARRALNADAFPEITYRLDKADVGPGPVVTATGTLTIAGSEKIVEVTAQGEALDGGRYRFTGSTPLLMTDFGVDPPKAMLGTLKTGDRIEVHFDVVAAPITAAAQ